MHRDSLADKVTSTKDRSAYDHLPQPMGQEFRPRQYDQDPVSRQNRRYRIAATDGVVADIFRDSHPSNRPNRDAQELMDRINPYFFSLILHLIRIRSVRNLESAAIATDSFFLLKWFYTVPYIHHS